MNITPDALPLPGPTWLFEFLLHFTFFLHLLAMNFLVGGAVIAIVSRLRGAMDIARWIETKLPIAMAFTVTLGVAPLLFVQAIYGHLLYTSSVLMAWPWFSVILLLLVVYSLIYKVAWNGESGGAKVMLLLVNLGLLAIGFLYVNNMTLALRPDTWAAKYLARPDGTSLNVGDPTFWPRYLHFMIAALAVMGMVIATVGARRTSEHRAHPARGRGSWPARRPRGGVPGCATRSPSLPGQTSCCPAGGERPATSAAGSRSPASVG